jgi:hypothetical protein
VFRRRERTGRAERLDAEADKFERHADQLATGLPADVLERPAVSREIVEGLSPDDPRWKRRAIDDLRQSARELRQFAAERRAQADD